MWPTCSETRKASVIAGLMFLTASVFPQDNILEKTVKLPGNSYRADRALTEVSKLTGLIFTYDTRLLNPERAVNLRNTDMPLHEVLDSITGDASIIYSVIGKHVILYRDITGEKPDTVTRPVAAPMVITGKVTDADTDEPLQYATLGIIRKGRGTVTNNNGDFILKVTDECLDDTLSISYVGYVNRLIPVRSLPGNVLVISMERNIIPIPEIIIRRQDPLFILRKVAEAIPSNYGDTPAMLTGFYREGVYRRKEPQIYSEAVVQIYKSAYDRSLFNDQIKVIRSRKIENLEVKDTLAVRLKAGLRAAMDLDIVRQLFDFIDPASFGSYQYRMTDIVTIDDQTAYVISFEQEPWITDPMMKGDIYVNADNYGIMMAEFEVNPLHISKTAEAYISRIPKEFTMKPEYVRYSTRYRMINGRYFLTHVRGDLGFLARGKKRLFNSPFNVFFELAVTSYRTDSVERFEHDELAPVYSVFSSTINGYDDEFWKSFDFLKPEDDLMEALAKLNVRLGEFAE